ncbi:hypothetical protein NDU88_003110 [Pleurodeles waltl]|uniref:Uncharacterized protein n=1 Tax=Pleurodeles waltl TaxID=8319 RepID=A0AAV7UBU4_PLEWA|nr:hypothetical protein NDU88_003110 [Pleurodeles waltl]
MACSSPAASVQRGGGAKEPRLSPGPAVRGPRPGPRPGDQEGGGRKKGGGGICHPLRHGPGPQWAAGAAPGHTDPQPQSQAPPLIRGEQSQPHVSPGGPERGLSCLPPFWSLASSGPAACKIRAEEPTDLTGASGGAVPERQQGARGSSNGAGWCVG